eukprot:777663-Rhodomonas_salina.1
MTKRRRDFGAGQTQCRLSPTLVAFLGLTFSALLNSSASFIPGEVDSPRFLTERLSLAKCKTLQPSQLRLRLVPHRIADKTQQGGKNGS